MKRIRIVLLIAFCHLLVAGIVSCKRYHGNPASEIVEIINQNRTAKRLAKLNENAGLGCMALQYVDMCKDNCSSDSAANCKPPEDDFTEIFGPNCGVELPTFGTITGHIVGCRSKYIEPALAFSQVLVRDKKALSLIGNKSHTEVGVGLVGFHKGPFFWCVLFSDGQTNSTFELEDNGEGIRQKNGCYSGSTSPCNGGTKNSAFISTTFISIAFAIWVFHLSRTL